MTVDELGQRTKAKHPEYEQFSDSEVGARVLSKYPEYRSQIGGSTQWDVIKESAGPILDQLSSPWSRIQSKFPKAAESLAENIGQRFPNANPKVVAGAMMPLAMAPEILGLIPGPSGEAGAAIMKASVPASRQAAVNAARELGIPLSRAEQTGSRTTAAMESALEKTPTGTGRINAFRDSQMEAKKAALAKASQEMGTQAGPFEVGMKAKEGYLSEMGQAKDLKNTLYSKVPDNVYIPLDKSKDVAMTLLDEQSKLYQGTQSPEVLRWSKIIQDAESSSGKGVTGGPETMGVTTQIPDQVIPPSTLTREVPSSLVGEKGQPLSYSKQVQVPGKTIPGGPHYGVVTSVGPEDSFSPKPNYYALKKARENLGEAIGQAKDAGRFQDYRDLTRLKVGLDADIETFANSGESPLASMVSKEFKDTYRQANAYSKGFSETYQNRDVMRLEGSDPEKVVDSIFKKNSETDIRRFRAAVGEGPFREAKQRFTQDLLESKNVKSTLAKYEPGTLQSIYSPSELEKLTKLGNAFDLIQSAEKTSGNPSGTARNLGAMGAFGAAGYALKAGRPDVAAAIIGIPYLASRGYTELAGGIPINATFQRGLRTVLSAKEPLRPHGK